MAEAGAAIFFTVKSPQPHGSGTLRSPAPHFPTPPCIKHPTSRHPHIPDIPVPAPHVSDTEVLAPSIPAEAGSSPSGTGGGRAEGRSPSDPSPLEDPLDPRARQPGEQTARGSRRERLGPSAGTAARARAPPPHLPRRCPSCLGGGGDAAARRPRPGRAWGPKGKAGGRRGGGRGRGPRRCVRSGARGSQTRARGRGTAADRKRAPGRGRGARPRDGPGRGARRKRRGAGALGVTSGARSRSRRAGALRRTAWCRWLRGMGTESQGSTSRRCGTFRDKGARDSGSERGEPGARPDGCAGQRPQRGVPDRHSRGIQNRPRNKHFGSAPEWLSDACLKELQKHP